jgi:hypothetical protein
VFEFTNTGNAPLQIQNVQPTCGCTTPEWSKEPVKPGAKGFIKATFNPEGRPGSFDKSINISTNAGPVTISFSGVVSPKAPGLQDEYRTAMGNLRFKTTHASFGSISPGTTRKVTLEFINTGTSPVTIGMSKIPDFLSVLVNPKTIKPNQRGSIDVFYDAKKKNDWGFILDYLPITLNSKQDPQFKLTISANINEDFSKLTQAQRENGPKSVFENPSFQFAPVKAGQKVEHVYSFKNNGKSPFIIRKIEVPEGLTSSIPQKEIKPGTSGTIKITFDTEGKSGMQNKAITLYTNDPYNSVMLLWLKGNVL